MIGFCVGFLIGGICGFTITCIIVCCKYDDDHFE